jgi:N-acetylneuraminic acid mutarotase
VENVFKSYGFEGAFLFTGHSLWQYDPEADLWTQKKSLSSGTGHSYSFCFVIGNKAYVGLGANMPGEDYYDEYNRNHHNYQEVWEYDASLDNWTQKQNFPGAPRVIPFTFSANGFGFMGGGDTTNYNAGHTQDFWKYDPTTDNWTRLADFPGKTSMGFSGFSLHNNGYVLEVGPGNPTAPTGAEYSQRLWKYNLGTNNWEQKAPLPTRNFITGTVFTISNNAYAAIGVYLEPEDAPAERADFWQYNPDTNAWTKKPDAGGGIRWFGSSFAIGSKGYLGLGNGGMYGSSKKDFWEYAPD